MGNSKVRRMCIDGMLVGIFFVLAKLTIKAEPIHIAFSGLAVIFATCYFGLGDGLIVALLGEFLIQMTSSYGIGPTTPLWVLPAAFRALIGGLFALPFRKKGENLDQHYVWYFIANLLAALFVTAANAGVQTLDALILGYSWAATIPLLAMRALSGLVSATVISIINIPLLRAIRKLSPNED